MLWAGEERPARQVERLRATLTSFVQLVLPAEREGARAFVRAAARGRLRSAQCDYGLRERARIVLGEPRETSPRVKKQLAPSVSGRQRLDLDAQRERARTQPVDLSGIDRVACGVRGGAQRKLGVTLRASESFGRFVGGERRPRVTGA